jgi:hyperosmotically inducible periplasmic protein
MRVAELSRVVLTLCLNCLDARVRSDNRITRHIREVAATELSTINRNIGDTMKTKLVATCIMAGALMLPAVGFAADSDASSAKTYVKDSVITTQIKAELAGKKLVSLVNINVDTDNSGMVTLSGTVPSKSAADNAVSIARGVKGVTSVENHIKIAADK